MDPLRTTGSNFLGVSSATWLAFGIVTITLILRLWGIGYGLPIIYDADEGFCVSNAIRLGRGDLNPHIFMWPHFMFYLLFALYGCYFVLGYAFGAFESLEQFKHLYINDPSDFYLIGRIFSAIVSATTVWLLYYLGKRYHSKEAGLVAAAFFGLSTFHLTYSSMVIPECLMTFLVLCTAYNAYRIYEDGELKNYVLAGIFLGLAVSTKYNAFLVSFTILFAHFLFVSKQFGCKKLHRNFGRLILAGGLSLAAFFIGTPFALLDYRTFLKDIAFTTVVTHPEIVSGSFGMAALNYIRLFFFPDGWIYTLNFIGVFIIAGVIYILVRHKKQDLLMFIFPLLHFLFFTEKTIGDLRLRYLIPMLPFFYLFGAVFTVDFIEWVASKVVLKTVKFFSTIKVSVALLFCLPVIVFEISHSWRIEAETGNLARKWIEAHIPAGSRILYTDYHTLALKQNIQSLMEYYEEIQAHTTVTEAPKEKLEAAANYKGPAFYIRQVHHGWNDENRKFVQDLKYRPKGVIPFDYDKFSLKFWLDRKFEYAIVFRNTINRYLIGKESEQFPALRQFYAELLNNSTLIKEFRPDPPRVAGYHIQIFRLTDKENSSSEDGF
ncbi:glycosyltransferase family 39 protein [candidate division KSB1 bacterium]|nr:glycosyltransferase family 39 protein [candidate division KSB1 bacterium]